MNPEINRHEHLAWCKQRALEYLDHRDLPNALASILSDLGKHPETKDHAGIQLAGLLAINGHLSTPHEMRKFIEGFR